MPNLKLLDLSTNSILTGSLMESTIKYKNRLILFNDNIFITNNYSNNKKYIEYLNKQFPDFDFGLKVLHLGFTYDKEKQELLTNLKLSPSMKISLIKLDLSFCGITTNVLIKFLKKNFGLFCLKNLKLKYNNIKSDIFEYILSDDILIGSLNIIDLSENQIQCKEYKENEYLVKFFEKYHNLKQIKLMNSEFIGNWNTNIQKDAFKQLYKEFIEYLKKENRNVIFVIDSDNWSRVEAEFEPLFSFRDI